MDFRKQLSKAFTGAPKTQKAKGEPTFEFPTGDGVYNRRSETNYRSFAFEGYMTCVIANRCINLIAGAASSIDFKVMVGDKEDPDHHLHKILKRPNMMQSGSEFFFQLYATLMIGGNTYLHSLSTSAMNNGVTDRMELLRPDRIQIKVRKGVDGMMEKVYRYTIDSKDPKIFMPEEICHIKTFNPMDDNYGMSPLLAAGMDIDQHSEIISHNLALLRAGGRPSGIIKFNPKDQEGKAMRPTKEQMDELKNKISQSFTGSDNHGRVNFMGGDMDWVQTGITSQQGDFPELRRMSAADIALALGVPAVLVGLKEHATYNNTREARLAFYQDTVIPKAKQVVGDLNEWISEQYQDDVRIVYDFDGIPAMEERFREISESVVKLVEKGIITRKEARDKLDMEFIEGSDKLMVPTNLFDINEVDMMPPANENEDPV